MQRSPAFLLYMCYMASLSNCAVTPDSVMRCRKPLTFRAWQLGSNQHHLMLEGSYPPSKNWWALHDAEHTITIIVSSLRLRNEQAWAQTAVHFRMTMSSDDTWGYVYTVSWGEEGRACHRACWSMGMFCHAFSLHSPSHPLSALYGFSTSGILSQQASHKLHFSKPQSSGTAEFPGSSPEFAHGFHS